jgi:hypothetical protein
MSFLLRGARRPVRAIVLAALSLFSTGAVRAEDPPIELMPDGSDVVAVIQIGKILKSPALAKLQADVPAAKAKLDEPMGKNTKLTPRHIESVFIAANMQKQDFVFVFTMTEALKESDFDNGEGGTFETIGDYKLFVEPAGRSRCQVGEKVVVRGPAESLRAILKRNDDAKISDELDAAWEEVDDTKPAYAVATLDALKKQAAAGLPPGFPITPELLATLESALITADVGEDLALSVEIQCADAAAAGQFKAAVETVLRVMAADPNTPPAVQGALKAFRASQEDNTVTVSAKVGTDLILGVLASSMPRGALPAPPRPQP